MVTMIRSDLDFILAQIKIAEADAQGIDIVQAGLVPNTEVPWGLRRVDGSNNNLVPGQGHFGSADQPFPRSTTETFINEGDDGMPFGPPALDGAGNPLPGFEGDPSLGIPPGYADGINWLSNNNYGIQNQNNNPDPRAIQPGDVVDADPRTISNLVVDQTANNPATIFKALQDAGLSNAEAFTEMGNVATAVQAVKDARADAQGSSTAVANALADRNAAQHLLDDAIANADPALAATLAAYQAAAAAAAQLAAAAAVVSTSTAALATELVVGPADPADVPALTTAQSAIADLLSLANDVLTALQSDPNVAPADLAAAQALVDDINQNLSDGLSLINVTNGISGLEDGIATLVSTAVADTSALAATLDGQITATLAGTSFIDPDIIAAQELFDEADQAYQQALSDAAGSSAAVTGAETALRDMLTGFGLTLEEAPTQDILKATLFIGNVAPDEGLSAPFNGWMTLFGQFFDHGLDLVAKGGWGTVYVPLQPDDPLYVEGSSTNFMALTRSTLDPVTGEPVNLTTPFVDQNQTYTSNASAQVFHREYEMRFDDTLGYDVPKATGRLLNGADGGLATWADVKAQARDLLGIELDDHDIHRIPELLVDPYGNFIPGPNGFPQIVTGVDGLGQPITAGATLNPDGTIASPVDASLAMATGHAFLDDIAHTANPGATEVADGDSAVGLADAANNPVSTNGVYDNELLDAHYITGDGRGNENIGLTAVHHVFHSEHNRQVNLIQDLLIADAQQMLADGATAADAVAFLNEWLDEPITGTETEIADALATATADNVVWDGERIFQAAKFPTEMQYQHLVFEEFARKVQPAVNLFNDYDATLDPAILAEFAHTVYRFGHSMLTETVDRLDSDWNTIGANGEVGGEQIGLIAAFLNPLEFAASGVNAEEAAGVIAQGMTRQHGNEIDEFVTEALRNNLVGLPLDLAALNIARGRETGVPTLNEARAEFFRGSGDTQVKPYESWFEFMQNLKNPASVINFIAAYGTHDSILSATNLTEKRDAATLLVLGGDGAPADRLDFLHATGTWEQVGNLNASLGGLNNVDFWIGGLAEKKLIFGGFLGSTFNFVFETQLEALQNGDRFYYLSRLANLNLTAQLENNKFSEMIHRNTTATHLPGDAFARPDYFLEADISKQYNADLGIGVDPAGTDIGIDPFLGAAAGGGTAGAVIRSNVVDGVAGRLEYTGAEHVVLGGTGGNDHLIGGKGDDTLWGDGGDDRLEGGDGNDFIFGGQGNDIITDLFGVDEIRSNEGDDIVSAGRGIKLIITDTGRDWVWGGVDDDEVLAGQGDDFVNGGDGQDFLIGGEGNDWLESGTENGLMLGDNGDLVQGLPIKRSVDSRVVGNDVLVATGGNADFDAETGDDIMVGGLGTDRFFGQFGFDWATYKNDPYGIEADMNLRLFAPPSLPASPGAILDRYAQTESLSGSSHSDILRGDDIADLTGGGGDAGAVVPGLDHALMDSNVSLIGGLNTLLGSIDEVGDVRFSQGNILLGGGGSDIIEGRGGNDILEGDAWLNVRIVRISTGESHDTMAGFQERVLAGEIPVADFQIVREILDTNGANDVDVAEFSGVRADYAIEGLNDLETGELLDPLNAFGDDVDGDGFITVRHLLRDAAGVVDPTQTGVDGVDQLKSIERLMFSDGTIKLVDHTNTIATGAPTISGNFDVGQTLTASSVGINDADGISSQIVFYWQVETVPGSGIFSNIQSIVADEFAPVTGPSFTLTAAEAGLNVRVMARFKDGLGAIETVVSGSQTVGGAPGGGGATNGDDVIFGTPNPDILAGLGGNDTLIGLAGDDILDGGDGANDTAVFIGNVNEFSFVRTPEGNVEVVRTATGEEDELIGIERVIFAANVADIDPVTGVVTNPIAVFTFAEIAAFADGLALPPNAAATNGADVLVDVANNVFIIDGLGGDDEIHGLDRADQLSGGTGDDVLFGGQGADTLNGGIGSDILDGGAGNDTAVFDAAVADVTFVLSPSGTVEVVEGNDEDELISIENLQFTDQTLSITQAENLAGVIRLGPGPANFQGNGTDEAVFGNGQANTIAGAGGDDVLLGFGGTDTLTGGAGRDGLTGGAGDDTVNGGAGDDIIFWRTGDGTDTVNGGANDGGGDTFQIDGDAGVAETFRIYTRAEAQAAGLPLGPNGTEIVVTRTVGASTEVVAFVNNVEEIVLNARPLAAGNNVVAGDTIEVIGDFDTTSLALNTITVHGDRGDDTYDVSRLTSDHRLVVNDKGGRNTMLGGRTQDLFTLLPGTVLADYTATDNGDGTTTYTLGSFSVTANNGATPTLQPTGQQGSTGTSGSGSSGSGSGNSTNSGTGSDQNGTQSGNGGSSGSTSGGSTGSNTVTTPPAETGGNPASPYVIYIGTAASDTATGGTAGDTLAGGGGDDTLLGFAGDDNLTGGDGDDYLDGGDDNDVLIGNAGADILIGGKGNDQIIGGAGDDVITGGDGNDTVFGNQGRDIINTGSGNDVIYATAGDGNDVIDAGDEAGDSDTIDLSALTSNATVFISSNGVGTVVSADGGSDTIRGIENVKGGAGNDVIIASTDVNVMEGGIGGDTFVFGSAAAANGDTIADFQDGDLIDLKPLFATLNLAGDPADYLTPSTTFNVAGEFRLRIEGEDTIIEGATDNDGDVDYSITVTGRTDLKAADFA